MSRLGKLVVAVAIASVPAGCKEETRREAERAAENLQDQKQDLAEETRELKKVVEEQAEDQRELAEAQADRDENRVAGLPENARGRIDESEVRHNANEIAEESEDVAEEAKDVRTAAADFEYRRRLRYDALQSIYKISAIQPMMIHTFASLTPLTVPARNDLNEKMQLFQMRLDEAANTIEAVGSADENMFEERDDAAKDALDRLEDARDDAWEALREGDRIEPAA